MDSIRLSKEYGVNPSVQVCNCCGKDMGLFLFGTAYKENGKVAQAPMKMSNGDICDDCKKVIDSGGCFIIETRDGETGDNPYRTGRLVAVKKDACNKIFGESHPISYMTHSEFDKLFGRFIKE